ncbi:MAG: TetR family transcriptional regulator [Acetobacteraceae bacterium]
MARSTREQAEQNRANVIEAASRLFRAHSVDKVGIADIMAAVGLTQGGFYKQFASKDALAGEACALAFRHALNGWSSTGAPSHAGSPAPLPDLVAYYLSPKPPEKTCPMIALAADAAAATPGNPLRAAYTVGVHDLVESFGEEAGETPANREAVLLLFAAMVGAAMLTRGIDDDALTGALNDAVVHAAAAFQAPSAG